MKLLKKKLRLTLPTKPHQYYFIATILNNTKYVSIEYGLYFEMAECFIPRNGLYFYSALLFTVAISE
jgi:hypothetical protein